MADKDHHKPKKTIEKMKKWQTRQTEAYKTYVKTSAVGLEVGLAVIIGALAGYFFDGYFNTSPYGILVGVIIGSIAAAKRLIMFAKKYIKESKSDDDEA